MRFRYFPPRVRRHPLVLGGAFVDSTLLNGEFDEFFLRPLREQPEHRRGAVKALRSFGVRHVCELADLHRRVEVSLQLIWGERDPFFPTAQARAMVATFPNAHLAIIPNAALFAHEEQPSAVADALRQPLLAGTP